MISTFGISANSFLICSVKACPLENERSKLTRVTKVTHSWGHHICRHFHQLSTRRISDVWIYRALPSFQAHRAGKVLRITVNNTGIPFPRALSRRKIKPCRDMLLQVRFEAGWRLSLQGELVQSQVRRNSWREYINLIFNISLACVKSKKIAHRQREGRCSHRSRRPWCLLPNLWPAWRHFRRPF